MNSYIKSIILIVFISIITSIDSFGIQGIIDSLRCKPIIDSILKTEYYVIVDSLPEYPGGEKEMFNFFMTNFSYPSGICASGKVIVEFIIDTSGSMINLKVVRSVHEDFDNEAIRVLRLMPKWKPGKCNGNFVPVKFVIPWNINLQ